MKSYTHLAFGFFSGLILMDFVPLGNKYLFFVFVLFGALLPDIDTPNSKISHKIPVLPKILNLFAKHRGIFHSLFIAVLLGLFVSYFSKAYGIALFLGYSSHLLVDGLTKKGVNLLHPISKLRISGPIETGKLWEIVFLVVIVAGIFLSLVK